MPTQHFPTFFLFFFLFISCHITSTSSSQKEVTYDFVNPIDPKLLNLNKKAKLSHLKVYWHDIMSGENPTSITVVPPPLKPNTTTSFGLINIFDNPLTLGPQMSSKLVGKSQGLYASASQDELGLFIAMNFAFIEGKYKGSGITILGRNSAGDENRELPIIGGNGVFRFARGYAQAKTYSFDIKSGDACVEYNAYVLHYY